MQLTHRRVNHLLTIVVIFMAGYIALLPYWPSINWFFKYDAPLISRDPIKRVVAADNYPAISTLVIPSIGLNEPFYEGEYAETLSRGAWRRPNSSKPGLGSNTVIAGHRYASANKVFYYLDKVVVGDEVVIYYEEKPYKYIVREIKVVPPSEGAIEAPTAREQLTLYTCTPMWSFSDRLALIAERVPYE